MQFDGDADSIVVLIMKTFSAKASQKAERLKTSLTFLRSFIKENNLDSESVPVYFSISFDQFSDAMETYRRL